MSKKNKDDRRIFYKTQNEQQLLEKRWREQQRSVWLFLRNQWLNAPIPRNVNWMWCLGSVLFIFICLLLASGIILSLWYIPQKDYAFTSVLTISRKVNLGWLFRDVHIHATGIVFIGLWLHMMRGIFYGSYKPPRDGLWYTGSTLFLLIFFTTYLGQILNWSQQGLYSFQVLSTSLEKLPILGKSLHYLLLGANYGESPRLSHIYALHIILAFIIFGLIGIHIIFVHISGSNNPLGVALSKRDHARLYPWAFARDGIVVILALILLTFLIFFWPDFAQTTSSWQAADLLNPSPDYSNPWYFAPFVSLMNAMPSPRLGSLVIVYFFLCTFLLPQIDKSPTRSAVFRPVFRIMCYIFFIHIGFLWMGSLPFQLWPESWNTYIIRQSAVVLVLFYPLLFIVSRLEAEPPLPQSITDYHRDKAREKYGAHND
ncbi:MAG: cytochrome b [Alphaproteobacteria bacterium]